MSGGGKRKNSERRAAEKRARKEAMRALYQGYRDKGINAKSKKGKGSGLKAYPKGKHPYVCGNIGCLKCRPVGDKDFDRYRRGGMPQWMYIKFSEFWTARAAEHRLNTEAKK